MSRSGIIVEPLSPQLCDFFGVAQNKGVLVRSVEKGSAGASSGLKAGDVIVRVNNETIHDMQDWKRALKAQSGKLSLSVVRDKREQTLQIERSAEHVGVAGRRWESFDQEMQAMVCGDAEGSGRSSSARRRKTWRNWIRSRWTRSIGRRRRRRRLTPEMEKQAREMRKQAEQMRKEAEKAGRSVTPEMKRQAEELHKQAAVMREAIGADAQGNGEDDSGDGADGAGHGRLDETDGEGMDDMAREMASAVEADAAGVPASRCEELKKEWEQENASGRRFSREATRSSCKPDSRRRRAHWGAERLPDFFVGSCVAGSW